MQSETAAPYGAAVLRGREGSVREESLVDFRQPAAEVFYRIMFARQQGRHWNARVFGEFPEGESLHFGQAEHVALGGGQFAQRLLDLFPDQCAEVLHFGRTAVVGQQGRDLADESALVIRVAELGHSFLAAFTAVVDNAVAGRAEEPCRDLPDGIHRVGLYEAHENLLQDVFAFRFGVHAPRNKGPQLPAVIFEYLRGIIVLRRHLRTVPVRIIPASGGG